MSGSIGSRNARTALAAMVLALVGVAAVGLADALTGDDVSVTSLYLLPVAWSAWWARGPAPVLVCLASAVAYLLGDFVFTDSLPEHPSYAPAINTVSNLAVYLSVFAIVQRVRRDHEARAKLLADLQEANAQVRTLQGLLPICAWCKRIRDDRSEWHEVEAYVAAHSDANFTHGICPACAASMHADTGRQV